MAEPPIKNNMPGCIDNDSEDMPKLLHSENDNDSEDDDDKILNYKAKNLDELRITTSTIAYDTNLRISYEALSKHVRPDNESILAVKSTCLPLETCLEGGKYTKAAEIIKRRQRHASKRGSLHGRPSRTLTGNQLYFQSAVEFVKRWGERYHNVRISPAQGSIQIQGVKDPIFETAEKQITETLEYIKEQMCINEEYKLFNRRIIIINVKTIISNTKMVEMYKRSKLDVGFNNYKSNLLIRINKIANIMERLMELQKEEKELPLYIPYKIVYITTSFEAGSYIRIKFVTPIEQNPNRKTTIKIFNGSKINFLGAPSKACPFHIYKFLDRFIQLYSDEIFYYKKVVEYSIYDVIEYLKQREEIQYSWVKLLD